jgi:phosphoribosylanthranilate isomerase
VCGITNQEDALKAVYYGAWAIGFIFYKKSARYVSPSKARKIVEALPPFITPVGVFVNQSEKAVKEICRFTRIHTIQFHGDERPVYCKHFQGFSLIKAFRISTFIDFQRISKYKVDAYLFDTYSEESQGGTGQTFDWALLNKCKFEKPFILAGGLNAANIAEALTAVSPYAVDVSSGVEKAPGIKSPPRIRSFFQALPKI